MSLIVQTLILPSKSERTCHFIFKSAFRNPQSELKSVIPADMFLFCHRKLELLSQPPDDEVWNQSLDGPPQSGNLFDRPGGDKKIVLTGHHKEGVQMSVETPIHRSHMEFVFEVGGCAESP